MAQAGSSDYCDSLTYDFNVRLRDITQARGLNHTKAHCLLQWQATHIS